MNAGQRVEVRTVRILSGRMARLLSMRGEGPTEFANRAGVDPAVMTKLINDGSDVRISTAVKLAKAGGVSLDWLVGRSDEQRSARESPLYDLLNSQPPEFVYQIERYAAFLLHESKHMEDAQHPLNLDELAVPA